MRTDVDAISKLMEARKKLVDLMTKEEIFWKHRAKLFWHKEGDMNTKFLHRMALSGKKIILFSA